MTILIGDTGLAYAGPLKTTTIVLPAARETAITPGTITLPQVEPASGADGTVTYTVQTGDLPIITPAPSSVVYTAFLSTSGKNNSGAAATVSYKLYLNGVAVASGSGTQAVNNSWFYTLTHFRFFDVKLGDVLEVRHWSTSVGVTLEYQGFAILATRIELTKNPIVQNATYSFQPGPVFPGIGGTPQIAVTQSFNIPAGNSTSQVAFAGPVTIPFHYMINAVGGYTGKVAYGDGNYGSAGNQSAANRPYYYRDWVLKDISYREVMR